MPAGFSFKLSTACLLALGAMLCASSQALASRGHEFTGSFGEPCTLEPCTGAHLQKPNGVAVNEATGDVYVVDEAADRVARFSAQGAFLSEFNGSGLEGEGKAAGSGEVPGEVPTGQFQKPETIAVDNSCALQGLVEPQCKLEDPSDGDVYVVDAGHKVVDKYTPEGGYVGQIAAGEEERRFIQPLKGVAVDPSGAVWVYQENLTISGFSNEIPNTFTPPAVLLRSGARNFFGETGFAVDSKGNFYGNTNPTVGLRIAKWSPSGALLSEEVDNKESSAVAVDLSNDNALIDNLTSVGVFDSQGGELERLGEEGQAHLSAGAGIGVDSAASTIYVADSQAQKVVVFGPQEPSAPTVESESFSEVTSENVELGAEINPRSEPGEAPSKYHFQFGRCQTATSCRSSGYEEVPGSAGELSPDFEAQAVGAALTGLEASTTYHFRVIAENTHGTVAGEEQSFTTQALGGEVVVSDNRGYELVSPPDKQGAQIEPIAETGVVEAATSGSGITYLSNAPTEPEPAGAANLSQNLSTRGSASWSSREITISHTSATGFTVGAGQEYKFFDPELALAAVQPFGEFNPQLSAEASESTAYLHELDPACTPDCFKPLVSGQPGFANVPEGTAFGEEELCKPKVTITGGAEVFCGPRFLGASEDLSHVVLKSRHAALSPGGPTDGGLYEWSAGALAPVSVLPGEVATTGEVGLGVVDSNAARGAISNDGSRVAWSTPNALYLRDMESKETVQLDRAEEAGGTPCAGCESGGGKFQIASSDGSRVFFTDEKRLSEDSGAASHKADLYECRIVLDPKLRCELSDLTPLNGAEAANVQGSVLGAGQEGEELYFVARGVQSGANAEGRSPTAGEANLYVRSGGVTSFVAGLAGGDETDWDELAGTAAPLSRQPTRVSRSGRWLEFMSQASPTGYDNRDRATGRPSAEVYLYDAAAGRLRCASCDPTNERPVGVEYHKLEPGSGGLVGGPRDIWPAGALVAANVPGWTGLNLATARYQPRYLNDEGRLFFDTVNPLVAQDSNGTQDVYEYEPPGIGSCSEGAETYSARSGGCVGLISSGKSSRESAFLDASESGDDVFFLTQARLSGIDTDNALDVYDAHVCTDSPCIVYPSATGGPCTGEASCKAPVAPQPTIFGAPTSQTFTGPGNLAPAPPAKPKPKTAEEIRLERLKKALKACRAKKNKKKQKACERAARKRYAKPTGKKQKPKAKAKAKAKKSDRRGAHR